MLLFFLGGDAGSGAVYQGARAFLFSAAIKGHRFLFQGQLASGTARGGMAGLKLVESGFFHLIANKTVRRKGEAGLRFFRF